MTTTTADVVVVGAGVIGAAIAQQTAQRGLRVALIDDAAAGGTHPDRRDPRDSATHHSAAQVRLHHANPHDAALAAAGLAVYADWATRVGGDCGFRRTGFAFLVGPSHVDTLVASLDRLTRLGIDTERVRPEDFGASHPRLRLDGVAAVAYEPGAGYADPLATVRTLIAAATGQGARFLTDRRVTGIQVSSDRVAGVSTSAGPVYAPAVVIAAGVHSAALVAPVAPAPPLRTKQVGWCRLKVGGQVDAMPMTIDDPLGIYFRPYGPGELWLGVPLTRWDLPPRTPVGPPPADAIEAARRRLATRLPDAATAAVVGSGSALEAYTPDHRPIVGPVGPDGLYLAAGFSGGGFKVAPAVGEAVSADLAGVPAVNDLSGYRIDRFLTGGGRSHPVNAYQNM